LELGDEKAVAWLFKAYAREEIAAILELSRSLSAKSRGFWRLRLASSSHDKSISVSHPGMATTSLEDIGCMKIEAIVGRGKKRDFIDLYFLLREMGFDLEGLLGLFRKKYQSAPGNHVHVMKSLAYFADADSDPEPVMLVDHSWTEVKRKLTDLVGSLAL
jgi:hypothetical protein